MSIKKIKILYVISSLKIGGTERRLVSLAANTFRNNLFDVQILLFSEINEFDHITTSIPLHIINKNNTSFISLMLQYSVLLKTFSPDIVHAWDSISAFYTSMLKSFFLFKFINSQIASAPTKINFFSKTRILSIINFAFSDLIISNTYAGLKVYNPSLKKSEVIYNGFDMKRLSNLNSRDTIRSKYDLQSKYLVVMAANFTDFKDQETLIKAAKIILKSRTDIQFVFIGDGKNLTKCKDMVVSEVEKKHIKFLGKITETDEIINIIDIGVLTTYTEGISNSLMEYMAFGKPVISTINPGTKELVNENYSGYLIESKDYGNLEKKINYILDNNMLAKNMGSYNSRRIKEQFNLSKMISRFVKNYIKVKQCVE